MNQKYPIKAFDGTNTADVSVLNLPAGSVGANGEIDLGLGVKVYRALLTQTGTDAPVATVTENTLGGDVVWTYNAEGTYIGTLADAFSTSTVVQCSGVIIYAGDLYGFIGSEQIDSDSVQVMTFAPGNGPEESQGAVVYLPSNSLLINQPIQILVRP